MTSHFIVLELYLQLRDATVNFDQYGMCRQLFIFSLILL